MIKEQLNPPDSLPSREPLRTALARQHYQLKLPKPRNGPEQTPHSSKTCPRSLTQKAAVNAGLWIMSLQLTMINNRKHAPPIRLRTKTNHTHLFIRESESMDCWQAAGSLVWVPITLLSTFRKHRDLLQGPNSTIIHSGITPLNLVFHWKK